MIPFILGALLAVTLTLPAFVRLIRQRDAAVRRGDLARAGWECEKQMHAKREAMLLDDLDFACSEAVALRERVEAVQARELPQLDEIRARRRMTKVPEGSIDMGWLS